MIYMLIVMEPAYIPNDWQLTYLDFIPIKDYVELGQLRKMSFWK